MRYEATKYILYARKSTDTEDKQTQSLDDQVRIMKEVAKRNGLKIAKVITESRSAKKPHNRPLFYEMIDDIENGKADGILCWAINRLSRNPTDSGMIQQLLQDEKIKHIQTADKSYYPDDNAILFSVEAGMSTEYIRELARGTKRGMQSKAEKGDKPGMSPIGYLNDIYTKTVIKDPERFELVRLLWDKMLTGTYSVAQITKYANEELHLKTVRRHRIGGGSVKYSTICSMFRNPFYTGKIPHNGKLYKGNHPAMVSDEEFERVQNIIDPHSTRPKTLNDKDFLFRGIIKCGKCGYAITAERKYKTIKSTGERRGYNYYHCTGKCKKFKCDQCGKCIREEDLVRQIRDILSQYTIDPDFFKLAMKALAEEEAQREEIERKIISNRNKRIIKTKEEISGLRRMRYRGEITDDAWFSSEMESLEDELAKLEQERNSTEEVSRQWREQANDVFMFARYAKEDFDSDDLEKKREVIACMGEQLTILDRTVLFTPKKYFIPIAKMNELNKNQLNMVRTASQQIQKEASQPQISTWLPGLGSNQQPRS